MNGAKRIPAWCFAVLALACAWEPAAGQKPSGLPGNYPQKPIRVVVASSPGGGSDISTRLILNKLAERWSHSFVIENVAGASGVVGTNLVANAQPDGYTLLSAAGTSMVSAALVAKVPYDVRRAFVPVVQLTSQPYILAVSNDLPVNSVKELLAFVRARPGQVNYASSGIGSFAHLGMEQFNFMTGIRSQHIPYKGIAPALTDLFAGRVQLVFGSVLSVMPHAKAGRLKALAVSSARRSPLLPDIPAIAEDVPGFDLTGWYGLVAPSGTPAAVVIALNQEVQKILALPEVVQKLATDGSEAPLMSPEQFRDSIHRELDAVDKLLRETGLKLDQ